MIEWVLRRVLGRELYHQLTTVDMDALHHHIDNTPGLGEAL